MSLSHHHARLATIVLAVTACGGGNDQPDAGSTQDDAEIDGMASDCNYTEASDGTNDTQFGSGTAETSGVTPGTRSVICGVFEHTHHTDDIVVDVDAFSITVGADTDVIIRLFAGAQNIELAGLDIYRPSVASPVIASNWYGGHAVATVRLTAGTYELTPFALSSTALVSSVPYRIEIATDSATTRCPEVTTGGYTEANDGGQDTGNDVIQIPMGAPPSLTTTTADMPEPSNIVLADGVNIRIAGEAANVTAADQYEDRDTYAVATGLGANEMTVRLSWMNSTSNLDVMLLEANDPVPVHRALSTATTGEFRTFSVKPSTNYWLLFGAKGATGLPVNYNATLCGAKYP